MAKRRNKSAQEILLSQSQPVPMPVAASLVYHHLNRDIGQVAQGPAYDSLMNSTSLALSHVSDIYYVEDGKLLRIPSEELAGGSFEDRGDRYRAASGKVYRSLSMRRIDVMQAMTILGKARAAIDDAKARARDHS